MWILGQKRNAAFQGEEREVCKHVGVSGWEGIKWWVCVCVCMGVCLVAQSCLTLCDPMDCSPLGSSVHGIFQARILEWIAISFSRASSWPTHGSNSHLLHSRRIFTHWAKTKWWQHGLLKRGQQWATESKDEMLSCSPLGLIPQQCRLNHRVLGSTERPVKDINTEMDSNYFCPQAAGFHHQLGSCNLGNVFL